MESRPFREFLHFVVFWSLFLQAGLAAEKDVSAPQSNLVVRGTLICVGRESSKEVPCLGQEDALGLKATNGQIYPLKGDKLTETLIEEKRIRSKDFQLTLKKAGDSASYEIVKSQFFRDGKLYDFYYFCDVCNITTHSPGLCMCCRQPTEYHEKLAE
jgi:hypothetical protein